MAEGFVGPPWHAAIEMNLVNPAYRSRPYSWWFDAARGGGMLGALGSHLVDLLRWTLGEVTRVEAELATFVERREDAQGTPRKVTADEHVAMRLRFENGALGRLATSAVVAGERRFFFQVTGSEGSLRLVEGEELCASRPGEPWRPVEVEPLPSAEELGMPEYSLFGRCLPFFLRDLLASVRSASALEGGADFADGLAVQRVLDAARRSAREATVWVDLD